MKLLILLLFSPAAVFSVQRLRKSANPNDEPFLPIHPEYPYNPKLMKRGIEQTAPPQSQQLQLQLQQQQQQQQQQPQALGQLSPELYAPKVDARDAYTASYNPSSSPYYSPASAAAASSAAGSALTSSPYALSSYASYGSNPYGLLSSYGSPYGAAAPPGYGSPAGPSPFGASGPPSPAAYGASPYSAAAAAAASGSPYGAAGASPYAAAGAYPNYYYQPPSPYYYPNYYNQPPYPPPPGYPSGPYKPKDEDEEDYEGEAEDDKRRGKGKKSGGKHAGRHNRLRDADREAANNQYVDGANFIISSAKDLDGESSTHRTPSTYNQIEDSDVHPRTVVLPKATYRLVSVSGQQLPVVGGGSDYPPAGYIKIQQLEQLMRQALAKLLAQNAAQQASLAQIQEAGKEQQQYVSVPGSGIAKTGLSYVVNPTILSRVNPAGQYNPSQLINTQKQQQQQQQQKSVTSVSLQQSPGIYIPPTKAEQAPDYGDYDSPAQDPVTSRSSNFQPTVEPTRNYSYSTYRPTQQTRLEDVDFGSKQKSKS